MPLHPHIQRVRDVFAGRWPDRIPICEQAVASSVASAVLGRPAHTGSTELHFEECAAWLDGQAAHDEFVAGIYRDTLDLHRVLDLDILMLPWRMNVRPTRRIDEFSLLFGDADGGDWWVGHLDPVARTFAKVDAARPPLSADEVIERLKTEVAAPLPSSSDLDPDFVRLVREHGQEFVVAGYAGMAVPMEAGWMEAVALEPRLVADWLDRTVELGLRSIEAQRRAGVWLINGGGDFAFNSGPIYSPAFFESVMAPRWKKLFDRCRQLGMVYVMRSDGNLWPVADSLFGWAHPHGYYECDYDAGMRFDALRARFADLLLIGNVSCDLLHGGTPEAVRRRATECIEAAAPRVIVSSANSILHGTPVANLLAMYEAAKTYPIPRRS